MVVAPSMPFHGHMSFSILSSIRPFIRGKEKKRKNEIKVERTRFIRLGTSSESGSSCLICRLEDILTLDAGLDGRL